MCKIIIEKITAYPGKGEAGIELDEGRFIENIGLEGDWRAGNRSQGSGVREQRAGSRSVSFLFAESREQMDSSEIKGLCFHRYRENITLRITDSYSQCDTTSMFKPGARLEVGEAVLEITDETKRCHDECVLHRAGEQCPLAGRNLFVKVLKGGLVRVGEFLSKM